MILIDTLTASFLPEERLKKNTPSSRIERIVAKVRRLDGALLFQLMITSGLPLYSTSQRPYEAVPKVHP
jgi:hypothetical protein